MIGHETDDLTQRGVAAAQDGERAEAYRLLSRAVQANPRDARAWLWLFAVADTAGERRACLERVLEIEPENAGARRELERLQTAGPPSLAVAPPAPTGHADKRKIVGLLVIGAGLVAAVGAGLVVAVGAVLGVTGACTVLYGTGGRPPGIVSRPVGSRPYPTPTPVVPYVALLSARGHSSASDGCVVEGEIKNLAEYPLYDLSVVACFCAAKDDTRTFDGEARIDRVPLPPGQVSRFRVVIPYNPQLRYAQVRFKLAGGQGVYTRDDTQEGGPVDWWVPESFIELK